MDSLTFRVTRSLAAGLLGALRALAVLAVIIAVSLPMARLAADWYVRGRLEYAPPAGRRPTVALAVGDVSPRESDAIRTAVGSLRYRIDPRAVSIIVVDGPDALPPGSSGEFLPYLDLIRIQRSVVDEGGSVLAWTLAHEIGHYVDSRFMTPAARAEFVRLRGIPPSLSWSSPGLPWERRPAEDFAEVFAALSVPSAVEVPGTTYGRVGEPAEFESLLSGVGAPLDRPPAPIGWRDVVSREVAFARDIFTDLRVSWPLLLLFAGYALFGAVKPASRAWHEPPPHGLAPA